MTHFITNVLTSPGGRHLNQDSFQYAVTDSAACWVLADGLGGHGGGEVAALAATDAVLASFRENPVCTPLTLRSALNAARSAVIAKQEQDLSLSEMRTTLVVLLCDATHALWAHAGDSRLYHFSQGRLIHQTLDHSVPQAMVDAGEILPSDIRHHEDRNRLLRSIGGRDELRATIEEHPIPIAPHDAFLLTTDGFWEWVTETAMEIDLAKSVTPGQWLRNMELRLRAAPTAEQDNYTALAVFVSPTEACPC